MWEHSGAAMNEKTQGQSVALTLPGSKEDEMHKLIVRIVLADAEYFFNKGFITDDTRAKVWKWAKGESDRETRSMIADWVEADTRYCEYLAKPTCKHFWPIYPLVWVVSRSVIGYLRKCVRELRFEDPLMDRRQPPERL